MVNRLRNILLHYRVVQASCLYAAKPCFYKCYISLCIAKRKHKKCVCESFSILTHWRTYKNLNRKPKMEFYAPMNQVAEENAEQASCFSIISVGVAYQII